MKAIEVFRIELPHAELDRVSAELHSLGTRGIEERALPEAGRVELLAYFATGGTSYREVRALATPQVRVRGPERVPDTDWEHEWRRGLRPRRVGPLWIRPSWCASAGAPELLIDPQQAFGSGEHATTRLALQLLLEALEPGDRMLDVGAGSGILALGALRMGAGQACAVDIDPAACANARENAHRNRLALRLVCGGLECLNVSARFELAAANLLLRELLPCLPRLATAATRGLILSGYLESERPELERALADQDWRTLREQVEEQSGDRWCARQLVHARFLQSSSTSRSV